MPEGARTHQALLPAPAPLLELFATFTAFVRIVEKKPPSKMSPLGSQGQLLALLLTCCINLQMISAGKGDEYFSEMPLSSSARDNELPNDQARTERLLDLLQLKQSVSDLLDHGQGLPPKSLGHSDTLEQTNVRKRVFCNGFTGCGGRFRGRRRQQLPDPEVGKRVFCNPFGCTNEVQKRARDVPSDIRDDQSEIIQQKTLAFADGWSGGKLKRLFCNGFSGCQNMGKRWAALRHAMSKAEQKPSVASYPKVAVNSLANHKRFFTSSFDRDVDKLIDSMRR